MFCPECGTQNPDTAKFCVRCGYQTPMAGGAAGAPIPPQMVASAPASSGSKLGWVFGGLALLVIAGLVGFILLRGSGTASQDENPTPRARNTANASNTTQNTAPASNSPTPTSSASNQSMATSSPTPSQPAANPTAAPAPKAVKKTVDCDGKCYRVYDQCMADYRQNPDPESICRAKQQTCLIKCQ